MRDESDVTGLVKWFSDMGRKLTGEEGLSVSDQIALAEAFRCISDYITLNT